MKKGNHIEEGNKARRNQFDDKSDLILSNPGRGDNFLEVRKNMRNNFITPITC
jgi:hypothetical protein